MPIEFKQLAGFPVVRSVKKFQLLWKHLTPKAFTLPTLKYSNAYKTLPFSESTRVIDAEYFWRMWGVAKDRKSLALKLKAIAVYSAVRTLNQWEQ